MPYGPWGGSKWFEQLKAGAADFVARSPQGGPFFEAMYAAIARDRGEVPTGDAHHKLLLLLEFSDSSGFARKGTRVALRR
eukprot:396362-Lingulodinium_polyedra.AAC.1